MKWNDQYSLNKKTKARLVKDKKRLHCHHCGRFISNSLHYKALFHPYMATVDHLYCKEDIRRNLVSEEENTVLSCYKCNQKRDREWRMNMDKPCKSFNLTQFLRMGRIKKRQYLRARFSIA